MWQAANRSTFSAIPSIAPQVFNPNNPTRVRKLKRGIRFILAAGCFLWTLVKCRSGKRREQVKHNLGSPSLLSGASKHA
jgi:hypothetical protein